MALLLRKNISATDKYLVVPTSIMMGIVANPAAEEIATTWMRDHWADLLGATPGVASIVSIALAGLVSSREALREWEAWLDGPDVGPVAEGTKTALDVALKRIEWVERDSEVVRDFLGIN